VCLLNVVHSIKHCNKSQQKSFLTFAGMSTLTISNENPWILRRWEMAHAFHCLMLATVDLFASRLAHLWCIAPVVLAR